MRTALSLATIIALAYADRFACALADRIRAHLHGDPVGTPTVRAKSGSPHHPCAVCRERRATEGDVCDECDVWITALAYVNRDASEHVS